MNLVPEYIKSLQSNRDEYQKKVRAIDNILREICALNGHTMSDDGHDSHHSYEKCLICGKTEKC